MKSSRDETARGAASMGRRRGRIRVRLATLATAAVLIAAWWVGPLIGDRIRLHLAERAIADDRLEEAEGRLDLLIAEHPARPWPRFLRAQVARKQGQITEAEEKLQRAIDLGLSVELARREHALLREGAADDRRSSADEPQGQDAGIAIRRR